MNTIQWIFVVITILHGLIHIMGFTEAFNLVENEEFNGKTIISLSKLQEKILGLLWLLTTLLFVGLAIIYLIGQRTGSSVVILGSLALIMSQILVMVWWHDAKTGTIANVIIAAFLIFQDSLINIG